MYDFFVQPQINKTTDTIFGYEVLLRKETDGQWRLPDSFTELSVSQQIQLIIKTAKTIISETGATQHLSFNLNQEQAQAASTIGEMILLQKYIQPLNLIVELTEALPVERTREISEALHEHNIELVIDDVGSDTNTFQNIQASLPYVDRIKFAMQNFRSQHQENKIPEQLSFWIKQAKANHLRIILEGIETVEDQLFASKMGINIQQGYFYGKPALIK